MTPAKSTQMHAAKEQRKQKEEPSLTSSFKADYKCNVCWKIMSKETVLRRTWIPSYCDKSGKKGRLYRQSVHAKSQSSRHSGSPKPKKPL